MKTSMITGALLCLLPAAAQAAPGDLDMAFDPGANNTVRTLLMEPDGKLVAGGDFTAVASQARSRICRLTSTGALDDSFNPGADGPVHCLAQRPDGRFLAGGEFSAFGGQIRNNFAGCDAAGIVDAAFHPDFNDTVRCLEFLPGGWIAAGGNFSATNGIAASRFVRISGESGALDTTYNPGVNFNVFAAALQPDGKLVIGGFFDTVSGVARRNVARLLSDGTVDPAFNSPANDIVRGFLLQPDGKIVMTGNFTTVGGVTRNRIARLLPDGTLDTAFNPNANGDIYTSALQTDGKILIGGTFTIVGGSSRTRIARLLASGSPDNSFAASAGGNVYAILLRPDGKVDAGGQFTTLNGVARSRLGRFENDAATQSLTVPSPGRVEWLRGGSSPETNRVTFDLSTDGGGTWVPLGDGSRIAGGWELTGLNLPASGQVRASARVFGAYGNGSSSIFETTAAFTMAPLLVWRLEHFGTYSDSGDAADGADPDKDGLTNLVEFAFALNPNAPDAAALPAWQRDDDNYILTFTRPANVAGITYVAEYSSSLAPGSWSAAANAGAGNNFIFVATAAGPRLYLRMRVTAP